MSDEELIALCTARLVAGASSEAERAFTELYQRHTRLLLAFLAARVARGTLEDVHQTVWLRVWKYLPEQFTGRNFRAWLFRIARNLLIDLSRRPKADEAAAPEEWPDARSGNALDALAAKEEPHLLNRCMEHLGEEEATIVRERLSGEPYEVICRQMDIAPARAHKLYHEALRKLQTCVERSTR